MFQYCYRFDLACISENGHGPNSKFGTVVYMCLHNIIFCYYLFSCRLIVNIEFDAIHRFYRAMHFIAKRGIAIACRLSVCLSVCPSVRLSVCNVGGL